VDTDFDNNSEHRAPPGTLLRPHRPNSARLLPPEPAYQNLQILQGHADSDLISDIRYSYADPQ
jgi:hypothetical protein